MALNAYQTTLKNALQKKKEPSLNLNPLDYPQGATTGATTPTTPAAAAPVTGTANTGNLTAAQIQSMREDAKRSADTAMALSNAKTPAEKNAILRESAMQNAAKQGVPGAAQVLATEQAFQQKTPGVSLTQQPTAQQTAFQAYLESAAPQEQYLWRNMGDNEMHTMDAGEQRLWQNAMQGYANGDYSAFNQNFQTAGNWGSYVDANGKVNGMLRYAGDGIGGYVPISNGKIMQNGFSGDIKNYAFYGPNGEVYTADANGNLFKTGTWTDDYDSVMKNGYYKNDVNDYGDRMFIGKDGQAYTYNNVPDEKLAEWGYVRRNGGIFYEPQTIARNNALKNGEVTLEQLAMQDYLEQGGKLPGRGGGVTPVNNTPSRGSTGGGSNTGYTPPSGGTPGGGTMPSGGTPSGGVTPSGGTGYTPYQLTLDQFDYGTAPEWNGTEYEQKRDAALEAAQKMRWDGSEYQAERDRLLEEAMRPYDGSPYDQQRDDALARYGEEWQGSEYQAERDAALRRAQNMQWNYDPNTDPVWQALQKQYRREGDRASQEALAQAAMRTGGLANSYAVTAASQTGDYYAAQLSDRLPQLYQDAYQRYLQEFQRQLGISDQYQGFDDREYSRWADQQGKNLDLADRYNQYGQQDYDQYRDRVSQQLSGADRYNGYDQTEYQRYLDQYGQQLDAADRYNNYGATEYDRYRDRLGQWNTDRNFQYGLNRDAVEDARYADETAYSRNYRAQRDAIEDQRYDQQWAQQLREYADAQGWKAAEWQQYLREYGDQLSEKERQWAYQMARDAVADQQYADQTAYERALRENELAYDREQDAYNRAWDEENRDYTRAWNEDERDYDRGWDTTKWNQALREYDDEQAQQAWNNDYKLSGKSSGGGYSSGGSGGTGGGGKTTGGDDLGPGQYKQGGIVYRSDKTHPQGQPMSAMYEQAYNDAWDKWQRGMDYALLIAEVRELAINKTITDYEGQMILNELKKWKERGREVDASNGGGGGGQRTQMTR